ncbi:site-specific recombinase resolvase [Nitrosomonas communis]|uniref:Site-specific recombinase resolvase n=1 Tax=Nitrosomonas communis TaxID=44574 RepID=A0A1I4LUA9_9PROT|nr:site-specific recombinase resolvase [Nitrosomonas communis]SFL94612.1 hypothetical protein SAMN05421863_1007100 [Nitrosomonas communis]
MSQLPNGSFETFVPLALRRRGMQRVTYEHNAHNVTLLEGLARAFYWQHLIDTGMMKSGSAIARAEKLHHSVVNELLRLTLLAPDIIERLMAGRQPRRMNLIWFQRNPLPIEWEAQRQMVKRFEEEV